MKKKTSSKRQIGCIFNIVLLIDSFGQYLHDMRGFASSTIYKYCRDVEYFLHTQSKRDNINIQHIHPKNIIQFILKHCRDQNFTL